MKDSGEFGMAPGQQLSPLAMAALGLLAEKDMHPYEMYQLLMHRHEDRLLKVRPGTLYHAVARLAGEDLVETIGTARDGNRPERTTYAILPAGRKRLTESLCALLSTPLKEYPRFPQALSEAHNLPAGEVLDLLGKRMAVLEEQLATLETEQKLALARAAPRQYWIDVSYQQHLLKAELGWVQGLCTELTDGSLLWGSCLIGGSEPANTTVKKLYQDSTQH